MSKLIVIRGPSGSGKSTVATELQKHMPRPTLLIHEDQIRFMFSNWNQPSHSASKQLSVASILSGLESEYDVIYEGISDIKTYGPYFQKIFAHHPTDNFFFYLDVSFDETLARHETRPIKSAFGKADMQEWLTYASPSKYSFETIIPESSSLDQTIETIMKSLDYSTEK